jgi:tetratricopeptide (TPR) repeat protein
MKKRFLKLFIYLGAGFVLLFNASNASTKPDVYKIDATKNAYIHNNIGLHYVEEKWYPAAVQEFKIAISLNPSTQATAVYYKNLGDTYMKMRLFKYAQDCYERAIKLYSLNFTYYQSLVKSFNAQNLVNSEIMFYEKHKSQNPYDMIILGLLYVESGDLKRGVIKLDEFCMQEPNLLITGAVRAYLKEIVKGF